MPAASAAHEQSSRRVAGSKIGARVCATIRRAILMMLGAGLAASVVSLCLFGNCRGTGERRALGSILGEVDVAIQYPGTQWMAFLCAFLYPDRGTARPHSCQCE